MLKKGEIIKIVLTGGHAGSTAYAVIEKLRQRKDFIWDIYFIGARSAVEGANIQTLEEKIFPKIGVKFLPLFSGRIQTKFSVWTIPSLIKIPLGFFHALYYLLYVKPNVILSFGGYVSFPVCFCGWLLRIPVYVHEQTCAVGRSNRLASYFSKKILLARKDSLQYFPKVKTVVVGNPISEEIIGIGIKRKLTKFPTILVTGGARGSVSINNIIEILLKKLLKEFIIIHQVGQYQYKKFVRVRLDLEKPLRDRYFVFNLIPSWDWFKFINKADIIISRAGANIVSEIIQSKRPSILIPLTIAYKDEQYKNALFAEKYGIARILKEEDLNTEKLFSEIRYTKENWYRITSKTKGKITPDTNSSEAVVDFLINSLNETH